MSDVNNIEDLIASQKMEEALLMKNFRKKFYALLSSSSTTTKTIPSNMTATTRAYFHLNKQRLAFIIKTTRLDLYNDFLFFLLITN